MTRRLCLAIFTVVACLAARPASAQPVFQDTAVVELDTVYANAQLGNEGVLVGLTVTEQDTSADPTRLLIYLPPYHGDSLCVEMVSYDAVYRGQFRYGRYDSIGWQIIELPTRHGDLLRRYPTHQLAPLAHISPTCDGAPREVLPTGWGLQPRAFRLSLLLNPQRVRDVTAAWEGLPATRCRELDRQFAFVFRHRCDLSVAPAPGGLKKITIRQRPGRTHRPIPDVIVEIWVPDDD